MNLLIKNTSKNKKAIGKLAKVSIKLENINSQKLYDSWAEDYDQSLLHHCGYIAPAITVNEFENYYN